jgi:hypothetical protein
MQLAQYCKATTAAQGAELDLNTHTTPEGYMSRAIAQYPWPWHSSWSSPPQPLHHRPTHLRMQVHHGACHVQGSVHNAHHVTLAMRQPAARSDKREQQQ